MSATEPEAGPPSALTARSAGITIVAQTAARAVTLLATLGATAIVARSIGIERYADWVTALSFVAMLSVLLDPGIGPVVVRRIAQEPASVPTPRALLVPRLALALGAVLAAAAVTAILRGADSFGLALALAAQMLPRAAVLNAGAWLQADHRLHRQTLWEAITAGAGLAALAVAASADAPATVLAVTGFLAPALVLVALMERELRRTPSRARVVPGPDRERIRVIAREVAPLALALVLVATYTRLHAVFVNAAEDAAAVARFLFAFQFVEQVIVVAAIVAGAILPMLAARVSEHDLVRDRATHELLVAVAVLGAAVSAGLVALAGPLTRVIGGPELAPAREYLQLLSPMGATLFVAFGLGYMMLALRLGARYLRINLAALAFALAGHAIFTLSYGAPAAARVAWATELLVVALAARPIVAGSGSGRLAALKCAAIIATCVAAAELAAAGVVVPAAAAALILVVAAAAGAAPLGRALDAVTALRRAR